MKKAPFWWSGKKRKTLSGSLERSRAALVEKFQKRREVAGQINRVVPVPGITAERVWFLIQAAERTALKAGVPRPRFPFEASVVVAIHTRHRDEGEGVWFRLADGRVFRDTGEICPVDPTDYD
jgi:hypothetical protein